MLSAQSLNRRLTGPAPTTDIQSAYYAKNGEYGYQIHDGLSGSMHDHVLNWKVDWDILGTKNTVGFHTIEPKTVKYVWDNSTRNTMHLVRSELTNEDNATLHWPENSHSMFLIYNKYEKNKYGEERAWRMMPNIGGAGMHATIQDSTNLGPSMNFAKAPIYVTSASSFPRRPSDRVADLKIARAEQHDSEFTAAHASNKCVQPECTA